MAALDRDGSVQRVTESCSHHYLPVDLDDLVSSVNPLGFICRRLKGGSLTSARVRHRRGHSTHTYVLRGPRDDVKPVVGGLDVNSLEDIGSSEAQAATVRCCVNRKVLGCELTSPSPGLMSVM